MKAWEEFLQQQERALGKDTVQKWLTPLEIVEYDARNLYLQAQNSFQVAWFEEQIRPLLKQFKNNNNQTIRVHIQFPAGPPSKKKSSPRTSFINFSPDLPSSHYSLENFIPTKGSWEVWKICEMLQKKIPFPFNPLFIYGKAKLGKTHLLSAMANYFKHLGKAVFYVKAETFTEHVVRAIRQGQMQAFRSTYRKIDFFIVEDVHLFANKLATQEEFFHTFNTLHTQGKQMVFSALVPPEELPLEPRLVSRFQWGLTLSIAPPHQEELREILDTKSRSLSFALPQEVKEFLIKKFRHNLASLFQALDALILRCPPNQPCTLLVAQRLLQDLLQKEQTIFHPSRFIEMVAEKFGVTSEDLLGKSQKKECSFPRQIAMYLLRSCLRLPFQKIGEIFQRDHSTVITNVNSIQEKIQKQDPETLQTLSEIGKTQEKWGQPSF